MTSVIDTTDDEIEVVDETHGRHGRIRIRERQGPGFADVRKASIFLTANQLEDHARKCLKLAALLRSRREEIP